MFTCKTSTENIFLFINFLFRSQYPVSIVKLKKVWHKMTAFKKKEHKTCFSFLKTAANAVTLW